MIALGTIESKCCHDFKCSDLELQLQASMILIATTSLHEALKEKEDIESYGLGFGVYHNLILLKLTMNFLMGKIEFTELYKCSPCPGYHKAIDCAIDYIVSNL